MAICGVWRKCGDVVSMFLKKINKGAKQGAMLDYEMATRELIICWEKKRKGKATGDDGL